LGSKIKADNIQVSTIPNTLIIQIKVQDTDSQRAATIANTLVEVLIQQNENLVSEQYTVFESNLNVQIDQIQKQINDLQNQINQINDVSISEQLTQVNQEIDRLKSELSSLENEINGYPSNLNDIQRASLSEKQAQLEQVRSLLNLYQQIQTNLTFIGKPGQTGLSRDDPRLSNLQSTLDLYQRLYLSLVNSRETVGLDRLQNTPNFAQINPAIAPKNPVRPLPLLYILLGGIVGFFISATAILVVDYFDESLKTSSQAEELLHLPVLGCVSDLNSTQDELVTLLDSSSVKTEALRSLSVNLEFAAQEKGVHTLLVMDADPKKSKTSIAASLGVVTARQGKRVILLEGDLKHPNLFNIFGMKDQTSIANISGDDIDLKKVSHLVKNIDGLTLISSGFVTENSIGWPNLEKWEQLLRKSQKQADLIIVDGPSVETADSKMIASKVEAVLLTVNLGHTRLDSVQTAIRQLQLMGTQVIGIVLYRAARYQKLRKLVSLAKVSKKRRPLKTGNKLNDTTISPS
jgi:Mrp family chromosome partitioning ATPase/uncharacterized protein involved in exopolysaccharide biosynthesis